MNPVYIYKAEQIHTVDWNRRRRFQSTTICSRLAMIKPTGRERRGSEGAQVERDRLENRPFDRSLRHDSGRDTMSPIAFPGGETIGWR